MDPGQHLEAALQLHIWQTAYVQLASASTAQFSSPLNRPSSARLALNQMHAAFHNRLHPWGQSPMLEELGSQHYCSTILGQFSATLSNSPALSYSADQLGRDSDGHTGLQGWLAGWTAVRSFFPKHSSSITQWPYVTAPEPLPANLHLVDDANDAKAQAGALSGQGRALDCLQELLTTAQTEIARATGTGQDADFIGCVQVDLAVTMGWEVLLSCRSHRQQSSQQPVDLLTEAGQQSKAVDSQTQASNAGSSDTNTRQLTALLDIIAAVLVQLVGSTEKAVQEAVEQHPAVEGMPDKIQEAWEILQLDLEASEVSVSL